MASAPHLRKILKQKPPKLSKSKAKADQDAVLIRMLRIQQGLWREGQRAIIVFEGFDAAGKGGAIRALTSHLDPRSFHVHPIGPPREQDQAKHYLYRFWRLLPEPGTFAVFDRSWYGRTLVEKVDALAPKKRLKQAYREINEFERMLVDDGIPVIKIFLAISPEEQLRRFDARLNDPYKQWKISQADIKARKHWDEYVDAADEMIRRTHSKRAPWFVVRGDDKDYARHEVLRWVTDELAKYCDVVEKAAQKAQARSFKAELEKMEKA